METVPLKLLAELVKLAQLDTDNLSHGTAKVLALALFRERKISIDRAAELCDTPLAAFMDSPPLMALRRSVTILKTWNTTVAPLLSTSFRKFGHVLPDRLLTRAAPFGATTKLRS
jgi:hypothetical protein